MGTPDSNDKSILSGLGSAALLASVIHMTVYLELWSGLYIDRTIAIILIFSLTILLPSFRFLANRFMKRNPAHSTLFFLSLGSSLSLSLLSLIPRIARSETITFQNAAWSIGSVVAIHFALAIVTTRRLMPQSTWSLRHTRRAHRVATSLAITQLVVFTGLILFIEASYDAKDVTAGVFTPPAPHLGRSMASVSGTRDTTQLKILNFNAWAVDGWIPRFIASPARDLETRVALMPKAIASVDPDIIIFQEVWKFQTRKLLANELAKLGYTYSVHGSNSLMSWIGIGNGLLIASRFPLDPNIETMTFDVATRIDEGLFFARKGAIKTRVNVTRGQGAPPHWIDVYASHLGGFTTEKRGDASYSFLPDEQRAKAEQARELVQFIKDTHHEQEVIVGTDLNTHPYQFREGRYRENEFSFEYAILTCARELDGCLGLRDPVRTSTSPNAPIFTYDPRRNFYARSGNFSFEPPGRIDYILVGGPKLDVVATELVFTENELSDHYGLVTTLNLNEKTAASEFRNEREYIERPRLRDLARRPAAERANEAAPGI